jgi:hypothetical protein
MRPWEKTFPDELWKEFGRLTNWRGSVSHRPKYWGHLVMELVYEILRPGRGKVAQRQCAGASQGNRTITSG